MLMGEPFQVEVGIFEYEHNSTVTFPSADFTSMRSGAVPLSTQS